jgi:pimeloyl-ACP methyl ester carboxylesterase
MRGEFVDVGGVRLYYYAAGTRGAGESLVLIHGCLTSSHLWSCIIPCLPAGHRTVIIDLLGHGRSDPPGGQPLTAGAHADRLVRLLDALNIDRACLIGHGLGAAIARMVARDASERVSRLALLNAPRDQRLPAAFRGIRHVPAALLVPAVRSRLARGYVDAERANRSLDHFMRAFAAPGGAAVIKAQLAALSKEDEAIADIRVPTAIVAGANDPFVAVDDVRALQAEIPGATLEVLTDAHYAPEESPEGVARVITDLLTR